MYVMVCPEGATFVDIDIFFNGKHFKKTKKKFMLYIFNKTPYILDNVKKSKANSSASFPMISHGL